MELRQREDHQELVLQLEHEAQARRMCLTFQGIIGFEFQPQNFQPMPLYLERVRHFEVLVGVFPVCVPAPLIRRMSLMMNGRSLRLI